MAHEELFSGFGWKIQLETSPLPDGRMKKSARAHRCDSVHIIAQPKPGTVLMIYEFRPHYGTSIWMLPSGKMDKENDPMVAAQRELQEETGFRAEDLRFYCTGTHSEALVSQNHLFLARNLVPDPLPQDANEMLEVHELPLEEAIEKVLGSDRIHTMSAFGLLRFLHEQPDWWLE